jgi:hypothetical protein
MQGAAQFGGCARVGAWTTDPLGGIPDTLLKLLLPVVRQTDTRSTTTTTTAGQRQEEALRTALLKRI